MTGVLKIRTTKEFGESTVSKILDLVENASSRKSKSENFISRFAKNLYTGSLLQCVGTGSPASADSCLVPWNTGGLGSMDLPCTDIFSYQLSVRTCDQHSVELFCRYRRSKPGRRACKRFQLSGKPFKGRNMLYSIRQEH